MLQKKGCKWCRGVLDAAERFMTTWHEEKEKKSSERRAGGIHDAQGRKGGGGSRETAVEESKETADRVARHQVDQ